MKCWRDLVHECSGDNCPMWMGEFDLTDMVDEKAIGLGGSKCALVLNEKLSVIRSMLDIFETLEDSEGINEEEFFHQVGKSTLDRIREPPARSKGMVKAVPSAKKQKKQTRA
jgi:hypothetical protein